MSTLLLPELARVQADSNRRFAHSVESAVRQSGEQSQATEAVATLRRRLTRGVHEALRFTLGQAAEGRGLWQGTLGLLDDGLEGQEAKEILHAVRETLDSWFALADATRELCQAAGAASAEAAGLAQLDTVALDVVECRNAAERVLTFLNRPRPAIDLAMLERVRQTAQDHFKSPEAIRAGLHHRQA